MPTNWNPIKSAVASTLQEKHVPQSEVLTELRERLELDVSYESGKVLSSMCTRPHDFASKVYGLCLEKNLGDPSLFPGTAQLEEEAVRMIGSLLSNPNAHGRIVSGGTEANILAMWAARNTSDAKKREVILPTSAHYSFDKAADLLGLKLIKVRLNSKFQVDLDALKRAISKRTVAIVGVAGTTDLGAVDPIDELSDLAQRRNLYFHVDAAFGGFIIPFLRELGYDLPDFDFKLPGVCSIAIDPHKMGMAPIPAGGILFRDESLTEAITFEPPYLSGSGPRQITLVATRPGASVAAVWALLKHLGREGYRRIVAECMTLTDRLAQHLRGVEGVCLVMPPSLNIIGIKSTTIDLASLTSDLSRRGWAVSLFPNHIRMIVMPHNRLSDIENFVKDLKEIVATRK